MQGTTLIVRISCTMLVLVTILTSVMAVDVIDLAALTDIVSSVLLVLEGMLDMGAYQRNDARYLGEHKEAQEQRTNAP